MPGVACGDLEVCTAAWLVVSSDRGRVRNALTASDVPEKAEDTVTMRARIRHRRHRRPPCPGLKTGPANSTTPRVTSTFALTWIAVGMGMASPNPEAAGNMAMPLILLPLISSAFIPADTMPCWFQPVAEYQPFTPAIETLRGLLIGTETGNNWWIAIVWRVGLIALGYRWSRALFNRYPE